MTTQTTSDKVMNLKKAQFEKYKQEQIKRKIEEQNKRTREDKRGYAERLTDRINA